jgi:hypothetical protein
MRILPQVSQMFENPVFCIFSDSFASLHWFIFLISVKDVAILSIYLDSIWKFAGESIDYQLFHIAWH